MVMRWNPFFSKCLMILPSRLHCSPSGLMAMNVCSKLAGSQRLGAWVHRGMGARDKYGAHPS